MSVVACPKCAEKVSLPPKTPAEAKVRCPLCGENYLLAEAMTTLPPMLEVLELPGGYSPNEDVDISAAAFLSSPDRPLPDDEDEVELQLEGGHIATAEDEEEAEDKYDQWGDTRSSIPAHELGEPQVKRELLQPGGRSRKKKQGVNPLFHIVGIVMGGVVAIPAALLILLWLPGSWRRDPMDIGPWLGKQVPFLVPAEFKATASEQPKATGIEVPTKPALVATKGENSLSKIGDKFESALKTPNGTTGQKLPESTKPAIDPGLRIDEPTVSDPLNKVPDLNPLDPLTFNAAPEADPLLPKPEVKGTPEPEPTPDPEPILDPALTPEPTFDPEPTPEPEPAVDPLPEVVVPEEDPLQEERAQLASADAAFNAAKTGAEKKDAAIALYRAAAELAAQLPGVTNAETGLETFANDPMKRKFVGIYASTWIEAEQRGTRGVVLTGVVKRCQKAGERFEVVVELPSKDKSEILLISPQEFQAGDNIFAAGKIVESAKDVVSGYEGEATKAIDLRVVQTVE